MLSAVSLLMGFSIVCLSLLLLLQFKRLYPISQANLLKMILTIFVITRLDDMLQVSGLHTLVPELLFIGSVTFLLLGPRIYQYVIARTSTNASYTFSLSLLRQTIVMLPPIIYLLPYWWLQPNSYQLDMLQSGDLLTPLNILLWPSYGDLVLLCYLGLCIKRLHQFGIALKDWFSFVEDKNFAGLKSILQWLAVIIFSHLVWTWVTWLEINMLQSVISSLLIIAQQIFILALVLEAVANGRCSAAVVTTEKEVPAVTPYTGEQIHETAVLIQQKVTANALYLDADLTLNRLARILQQPRKRLSLALNQQLKKTFYDYINDLRVHHAKKLITTQPNLNLMDIAMQSGFNSKSVFNNAFKKYATTIPSEYRRRHNAADDN